MCRLRATSRQRGMIVSAQLGAPPLGLLTKPFRLDALATTLISVRIGARAAVSPTPPSAAQEIAFSALACGDSGPASPQPTGVQPGRTTRPVSTTWKNSNRRYRQVSAGHSEQIGVKVWPIDRPGHVYENGSAPMKLANTAVEDPRYRRRAARHLQAFVARSTRCAPLFSQSLSRSSVHDWSL